MARLAVVTVPYFLTAKHRSLADEMLSSIRSSHDVDRIAVVNRVRPEEDDEWLRRSFSAVLHNDHNNLARAWNRGISEALARGAEGVIVANTDIVFHPYCLDNLYECMREESDAVVWSAMPWRNARTFPYAELRPIVQPGVSWPCFMVNARLFAQVGTFDEGFAPAYREDSDMEYRIKLRGLRTAICRAALYCDAERGTIRGLFECARADIASSAKILLDLRHSITRNDERYVRKWGGWGGQETFLAPFNGEVEE